MKSYQEITTNTPVVAAFGAKTLLINTGTTSVCVVDIDTEESLQSLSARAKNGVLNALHAVEPGQTKALPTGSYNLTFLSKFGGCVVVMTETKVKPPVNNESNVQESSQA